VPNPVTSDEEAQRFWHADLEHTPLAELRREVAALRQVVAISANPDSWFSQRIRRLKAAISRRRAEAS
jgi:hypothetical protein